MWRKMPKAEHWCAERLYMGSSPATACVRLGKSSLLCGIFLIELKDSSQISVLEMLFLPSPLSGYLVRFWEHFWGIQTLFPSCLQSLFNLSLGVVRRAGLTALDLNIVLKEQKRDSLLFPHCTAWWMSLMTVVVVIGLSCCCFQDPQETSFFCTLLHKSGFDCFLRSKPKTSCESLLHSCLCIRALPLGTDTCVPCRVHMCLFTETFSRDIVNFSKFLVFRAI